VGKTYHTEPFRNHKLLIVGESSFERDFKSKPDHLQSDTEKLVNGEFSPRYSGFWRFIQRSLTGEQRITEVNQADFWNSVSLVNLVQQPMSDKLKRPSARDYECGAKSLRHYIDNLNPEAVVVFSGSSWSALINEYDMLPYESSSLNSSDKVMFSSSVPFLLLKHPSSRPKRQAVDLHSTTERFLKSIGSMK
jgi:hypothetical protein